MSVESVLNFWKIDQILTIAVIKLTSKFANIPHCLELRTAQIGRTREPLYAVDDVAVELGKYFGDCGTLLAAYHYIRSC